MDDEEEEDEYDSEDYSDKEEAREELKELNDNSDNEEDVYGGSLAEKRPNEDEEAEVVDADEDIENVQLGVKR